jgi:hypothetical protein
MDDFLSTESLESADRFRYGFFEDLEEEIEEESFPEEDEAENRKHKSFLANYY